MPNKFQTVSIVFDNGNWDEGSYRYLTVTGDSDTDYLSLGTTFKSDKSSDIPVSSNKDEQFLKLDLEDNYFMLLRKFNSGLKYLCNPLVNNSCFSFSLPSPLTGRGVMFSDRVVNQSTPSKPPRLYLNNSNEVNQQQVFSLRGGAQSIIYWENVSDSESQKIFIVPDQ